MSSSERRRHATEAANASEAVNSLLSPLANGSQTSSADMNDHRGTFRRRFIKVFEKHTNALVKTGSSFTELEVRLFFYIHMVNHNPYREFAVDQNNQLLDALSHGTAQDAMADLCLSLWESDGDRASSLLDRQEISRRLGLILGKFRKLSKADVSNWIEPQKMIRHKGIILACRSSITSGWSTLDPLMPSTTADQATRYEAVYKWKDFSCAVDACLGLAIELDAWRVREDQYVRHRSNNQAVDWLRTIARTPWGTLNCECREVLRDDLHSIIAGLSTEHPEVGQHRPALSVYQDLFKQLPQVSSATLRRHWCCDPKSSGWSNFQERNCYPISITSKSKSIGSLLQSAFTASQADRGKDDTCCTKEAPSKCKEKTTQLVIVGRLSPIIVLTTSKQSMDGNWMDPGHIPLRYLRMDHHGQKPELHNIVEATATYELVAVIYHQAGHYVVESQIRGARIHMDMLQVESGNGNGCCIGSSRCRQDSWALPNSALELMVFRVVVVDESKGTRS